MKRRKFIRSALGVSGIGMVTGCMSEDSLPESDGSDGDGSGDTGATPTSYSASRVKSEAEDIPYDDLLRNIETYTGEEIHSTGKITQSFNQDGGYGFNVAMSRGEGGYWDTSKNSVVVWDGLRYIEDDVVEFWGSLKVHTNTKPRWVL
jgi:hypothetical protein